MKIQLNPGKYYLIILAMLAFTSCNGQKVASTELLDKLKYDVDRRNYGMQTTFYYPTEISVNDYPILKGLEFFGTNRPAFADIAINRTGEQELKILIDLKNYKKQESPILKIILFKSTANLSVIASEWAEPENKKLIDYELRSDELSQEDLRRGYFVKTIKFNAKIPVQLISSDQSVPLKNSAELLDKLYNALKQLTDDLNSKKGDQVVKAIQKAEYETAQLRGMKREWVLNERKAILSNTFSLLPKDRCELKIYGNGKLAALVEKSKDVIKQSAITSTFKKKNPQSDVLQLYNLYYHQPDERAEMELIKFDGYAITKYGEKTPVP